ncbi:MAG TPA: hypothetical protein DEF27_08210, partial [Oscillatoriales bacterium UBA8482]|nr:hypothetical protein [Oscillatoriales bacterium UBA8482]
KSPRSIFFGTAAALLLASFLGVIVGQGVAEVLPTHLVKIAAAIGFAVLGIRLLWFSQEENIEINKP